MFSSSSRRTFLLFLWRHKGAAGERGAALYSNVWHYQTSYCTAALAGLNGLFVGGRGGHHLSKPISN